MILAALGPRFIGFLNLTAILFGIAILGVVFWQAYEDFLRQRAKQRRALLERLKPHEETDDDRRVLAFFEKVLGLAPDSVVLGRYAASPGQYEVRHPDLISLYILVRDDLKPVAVVQLVLASRPVNPITLHPQHARHRDVVKFAVNLAASRQKKAVEDDERYVRANADSILSVKPNTPHP